VGRFLSAEPPAARFCQTFHQVSWPPASRWYKQHCR
jgi:hypothetical protein